MRTPESRESSSVSSVVVGRRVFVDVFALIVLV